MRKYLVLIAGGVLLGALVLVDVQSRPGDAPAKPSLERLEPATAGVPTGPNAAPAGIIENSSPSLSIEPQVQSKARPILGSTAAELLDARTPASRKLELIEAFAGQGGAVATEMLYQTVRSHRRASDQLVWTRAFEGLCKIRNPRASDRIRTLMNDPEDDRRSEMVRILDRTAEARFK